MMRFISFGWQLINEIQQWMVGAGVDHLFQQNKKLLHEIARYDFMEFLFIAYQIHFRKTLQEIAFTASGYLESKVELKVENQ